jgi:hypothetical protein
MSKHRRAAKVDANQSQIVEDLEKAGCTVDVGHDDIFAGIFGFNFWFELKSDNALDKNGNIKESQIKPRQKKIRATWKGQYDIVSSSQECIDIIQRHLRKFSKHYKEFKNGKN